VHRRDFLTREGARQEIFKYIEIWYNRQRRHSSLGYVSPDEFERQEFERQEFERQEFERQEFERQEFERQEFERQEFEKQSKLKMPIQPSVQPRVATIA
jgi:hypothetical protein